jgi:hypothetical protein
VVNAYDVVPLAEYKRLFISRQDVTGRCNQRLYSDPLDTLILSRLGVEVEPENHPGCFLAARDQFQRELNKVHVPGKPLERWPGLPDRYIATRFYKNRFMYFMEEIDFDLPVVNLRPREVLDDHEELKSKADIVVEYEARDSFEVISRVVAHAERFYCTYGGIAHIGPKFGIPTTGYATQTGPCPHKHMEKFKRVNF